MKSGSVGKRYIPKRGDIVWVVLDPVAGREQAGRRPVIVLSDTSYNQRSGIAICCPITSQIKHYPFEVLLPEGLPLSGVVLTDQIKALDIASRIQKFECEAPPELLAKVVRRIVVLISPPSQA